MSQKKKIAVDTLIISDVHLGYEFSRPQKLIETLALYDFKQLILNGDIFDDLNFNRLNSDHWDVLSLIRHLTKYYKVVWVIGNHDGQADILSRLIGVHVHNQYIWSAAGRRYLAIHGHQFDRFLSSNPIIGGVASKVYNLIKRFDRGESGGVLSRWIMHNNRSWLRLSDEVAGGSTLQG
jgi:metallophosphoesterase superfamily enzyme